MGVGDWERRWHAVAFPFLVPGGEGKKAEATVVFRAGSCSHIIAMYSP